MLGQMAGGLLPASVTQAALMPAMGLLSPALNLTASATERVVESACCTLFPAVPNPLPSPARSYDPKLVRHNHRPSNFRERRS